LEQHESVISITVAGGFAYSDVPEIGPTVLVVTDNDIDVGQKSARKIADRLWELREDFIPSLTAVSEAVTQAIESDVRPVILADVGDNIGAGTPGDSTFILRELIDQGAASAVVIIADPQAVETAVKAGIGQQVDLAIGGKCDQFHGDPVQVNVRVTLISDGVFRNRGPMRDGIVERMGRTAVVDASGIKIVLTEIKMPPWNLEQLRSVGISPEREAIIVLKSAVAFRAAYETVAGKIIAVNSPGLSSVDLGTFNYKYRRRPLFPLDEVDTERSMIVAEIRN
jgi:microcystin degradation protein MlrC